MSAQEEEEAEGEEEVNTEKEEDAETEIHQRGGFAAELSRAQRRKADVVQYAHVGSWRYR